MGLDATVRCRCFEEGKLSPGPIPYDDLYIDEDGYLSSRRLDAAYAKYGFKQFRAKFGDLQDAFDNWLNRCCEHEDGDYCLEWVSNWAGVARFCNLVEEAGGEREFPLLSRLIPEGNGGTYPAAKAKETLDELERFIEAAHSVKEWVLQDVETETEIWTCAPNSSFAWMHSPFDRAGMDGDKAFFEHAGNNVVKTSHFKQVPAGPVSQNGNRPMRIICLDTGAETSVFNSIGPKGSPQVEREFLVVSKEAPFLYEGKYPTAERIKRLLQASIEIGNPIRWC
ncbi:MAG: hypothetical protein Q4C41_07675 [Eggerthellaceae bacterium]|nr:hypothetical protein [Eggerthellaceae bacterium]